MSGDIPGPKFVESIPQLSAAARHTARATRQARN